MAIKVVPEITAPDLAITGDVEIDAYTNVARVVATRVQVAKEDVLVGSRPRLNFHEGSNVTLTITEDAPNDEIDIVIAATGGSGSAHTIRDNGTDKTQRDALNFVTTNSIIATANDDAGNNETEIALARAALTGAVTATQNSNATLFNGIRFNGGGTTARSFINFIDGTFTDIVYNDDAVNDEIELKYDFDTAAFLAAVDSTSIVVNSSTFERAALTGDISASQNSNTTAFRSFAAKSVLVNATNSSAVPSDLAGSAAFQYLRVNSANTALEWATLSSHASTSVVYNSNTFERAALTGAIAASQNSNATLFSGIRVNGSATTDRTNINFLNGSGVTITPTDDAGNDEIELSIAVADPTQHGESGITGNLNNRALPVGFKSQDILAWTLSGNATLTGIDATGLSAGFQVIISPGTASGLTLTIANESASSTASNRIQTPGGIDLVLKEDACLRFYRANSRWFVETLGWPTASTSITYSADQIQRAALSGAIVAAANANTTVFAGIRANGSATTDRTNINFISGSGVTVTATDDAGNDEIELTFTATAASVTPTTVSVFGTPTNTGVPFIIYVSFAAAAAGTADDVTVFSSTAPFNFRILESWLVTSTAITSSTVQARTATGGLGSALSTAMSSTVTGKTSDNSTATATVSSGGSVFLRRSDRGVAGEFFAMCVRT